MLFRRLKYALEGRSPLWNKTRKKHLKENPNCCACETIYNLEVHHIKPFEFYPDLELEPTNLITLCEYCHLVLGHFKNFRTYNPYVVVDSLFYRSNKKNNAKIT